MTGSSSVNTSGRILRNVTKMVKLNNPTKNAAMMATLAVFFAASLRLAPIRLATRVEVAMASGKGMLKDVEVGSMRCSKRRLDGSYTVSWFFWR